VIKQPIEDQKIPTNSWPHVSL